jgi:hypothetical protein
METLAIIISKNYSVLSDFDAEDAGMDSSMLVLCNEVALQ